MSEESLIHEVEESMKQERMEKLWKEYGAYLIGAAVLVVLLTALITGWKSWNTKLNTSQTTAILQALDREDNIEELNRIASGMRPNHEAIAHLTAAGLLLRDGENDEALMHYNAAARAGDAEPALQDLAQLMAVRLEWQTAKPEEINAATMLGRLKPLTSNKNSPWRHHAHMQAALIKAHLQDDYAGARQHLDLIMKAEGIPQTLQQRARALHHVYGLEIAQAESEANKVKEEPEG